MSFQKIRIFAIYLLVGSFFIIDRLLKIAIFENQTYSYYLSKPWFGIEYFENTGIAFGIPIPWYFACIYTPIILFAVWKFVQTKSHIGQKAKISVFFLSLGAFSNLFDRVYYHFTIDYIRIYTSLINIADIMILVGAGILLSTEFKKNKSVDKV